MHNTHFNASLKNIAVWGYWNGVEIFGEGTRRSGAPWFEALTEKCVQVILVSSVELQIPPNEPETRSELGQETSGQDSAQESSRCDLIAGDETMKEMDVVDRVMHPQIAAGQPELPSVHVLSSLNRDETPKTIQHTFQNPFLSKHGLLINTLHNVLICVAHKSIINPYDVRGHYLDHHKIYTPSLGLQEDFNEIVGALFPRLTYESLTLASHWPYQTD